MKKFWTCVIGPVEDNLPYGSDSPMRVSVESAFNKLTGKESDVCLSGWKGDSEIQAEAETKDNLVYAIRVSSYPEPKLKELTTGELLRVITNFAKDYAPVATESIRRNSHMNQVTIEEDVDQVVIDAAIIDFINYITSRYGVDYALNTYNLTDPKQDEHILKP